MRWSHVGARVNADRHEVGFELFVEGGYLVTIEGFSYGDAWPERIESFEIYVPEAQTPPRS